MRQEILQIMIGKSSLVHVLWSFQSSTGIELDACQIVIARLGTTCQASSSIQAVPAFIYLDV